VSTQIVPDSRRRAGTGIRSSRNGGEQHIRFQPSAPLNESVLTTLPEVSSVLSDGEQLLVTGNNEALQAVIAVLARQGVIAQHLRVEQATLDDAFVALTGNQR
jgi:ABC-2 type transport system ATP-binding protein